MTIVKDDFKKACRLEVLIAKAIAYMKTIH